MKKNALKQVITGMALLVAISMAVGNAYAVEEKNATYEASPRYEQILTFYFTPTIEGHYASCSARVSTKSPYTADITVELQRYDGGWFTENQWSDRRGGSAAVNGVKHYILSDYTYRFKGTANVYDSSGNLLESDVRYSSNMSC